MPCGESICGTLEREPSWDETGLVPRDEKNPDERLQSRSLQALTILYGFRHTQRGWRNGKFYDPWSGKTYPARVRRIDERRLHLRGCIAPLICRSFEWTKVGVQRSETDKSAANSASFQGRE